MRMRPKPTAPNCARSHGIFNGPSCAPTKHDAHRSRRRSHCGAGLAAGTIFTIKMAAQSGAPPLAAALADRAACDARSRARRRCPSWPRSGRSLPCNRPAPPSCRPFRRRSRTFCQRRRAAPARCRRRGWHTIWRPLDARGSPRCSWRSCPRARFFRRGGRLHRPGPFGRVRRTARPAIRRAARAL